MRGATVIAELLLDGDGGQSCTSIGKSTHAVGSVDVIGSEEHTYDPSEISAGAAIPNVDHGIQASSVVHDLTRDTVIERLNTVVGTRLIRIGWKVVTAGRRHVNRSEPRPRTSGPNNCVSKCPDIQAVSWMCETAVMGIDQESGSRLLSFFRDVDRLK